MPPKGTSASAIHGFTLVELSIVLVIIGLLVGGIFVGRDLIRSGEDRKTVSQIQQIKTAINTFRLKYNCLPGDCANATDYWPTAINGNANGHIEDDGLTIFESYNLWDHLMLAGLLAGPFIPVTSEPDINNPSNFNPPSSPYGFEIAIPGNYYINAIYGSTYANWQTTGLPSPANNFLVITTFPIASETTGDSFVSIYGLYYPGPPDIGLHPNDAQRIDQKIDDGLPLSGNIVAVISFDGVGDQLSCSKPDGENLYNLSQTKWGSCALAITMQ